tara:strand:- start:224 stop:370 length:147 start_codon:yes stop_codon:yes gene_type:complete
MGTNDSFTVIKVRKYDVERLKQYALGSEAHWEAFKRVMDTIELQQKVK